MDNRCFDKLLELQSSYPNQVKLYQPASEQQILITEKFLNTKLHKDLIDLYLFSNGLGIIDYCFLGNGNKKIANLIDANFTFTNSNNFDRQIEIIGTSVDESYFMNMNSGNIYLKATYEESLIHIASNFNDFLKEFIDKLEYLLSMITGDDIIYLDDDQLPEGFSEWKCAF